MKRSVIAIVLTALFCTAPAYAQEYSGWKADAWKLIEQYQYHQALDLLAKHQDAANDPEFLFLRGTASIDIALFKQADADLHKAIELNGQYAEAYAQLALVDAWLNRAEPAKQHAERSLQLKQTAEGYYVRARIHFAAGDTDAAQQDIAKAIEMDKNDARFYVERATIFRQLNQFDQAMADYNRAINLDKKYYKAYLERSAVYVLKGDPVGARTDINQCIALAPRFFGGYLRRGYILQQRGDVDQALADFTKAVELGPEAIEAYYAKAELLLQLGRPAQAEQVTRQVLRLRPDAPDLYVLLHYTLGSQGKLPEAEQSLNKAIELAPDDWRGYNMRGQLYLAQNKVEQALPDFETARSLAPKRAEPRLNIASVKMAQKNPNEALQILNELIAEHPDNITLLQMRMSLYEQTGRSAEALADLERIEKLKKKEQ